MLDGTILVEQVLSQLEVLLPALFDALSAPSDRVVLEALAVQAAIAIQGDHFKGVMQHLLDRFRGTSGARLLQRRGSMAVRRLCMLLGGERVMCTLAAILEDEPDLKFASAMVQALNLILLTAPEVSTSPPPPHPGHTQSCPLNANHTNTQ